MLLKIHPINPQERKILQVIESLSKGGVIIYPTDTVYALACSIDQKKAFEKICRIKNVQPAKAKFSFIFSDLRQAARYSAQLDNSSFRIIKKHLPGPFTFIVKAGNQLPSFFHVKKKTIGIRIPDHTVSLEIVRTLQMPLLTTSLKSEDEVLEYYTDPDLIYHDFGKRVDIVIDSGPGTFEPSTLVDLSGSDPIVLRQGKGELQIV
jgi:tRNA threonylcarbamoyl adenosine modification protein (Sua5/YciO/YrdC/YwlC family)